MLHTIVLVPPEEVELFIVLPWFILSWFVFLRMCCVRVTPVSIWNVAIYLPALLVYKFHLLRILQYNRGSHINKTGT